MTVVEQEVYLEVRLSGVPLDNVLSARVSLGFDQPISQATVVLASEPEDDGYAHVVEVFMGAGGDGGLNNALRFRGSLYTYDRKLNAPDITLLAFGSLQKAAEFRNHFDSIAETTARQEAGVGGLLISDFFGPGPATDADVVLAALERVPDLAPNIGFIGGAGTDVSGLPPDATLWRVEDSALQYALRYNLAGWALFNSIGDSIFRAEISGWPSNSPDFTFTEGLDIFDGSSKRTRLELKNCARVDGYNYGLGPGVITYLAPGSNGIQGDSEDNPQEIQLTVPLAGRINTEDTGPGFSCQEIAEYLLDEWNRELVRVTLTTPRDDIIGPGQTHLITTVSGLPGALGTAEPMWVQHVDISVDAKGEFNQAITYLGGGVADGFDSPIDWSAE